MESTVLRLRSSVFPQLDLVSFLRFQKFLADVVSKTKTRCNDRFQSQFNQLQSTFDSKIDPDTVIHNYSRVPLSDLQKQALLRGVKFCIPSRPNRTAVRSEFELLYHQLSSLTAVNDDRKSWLKNKLVSLSHQICSFSIPEGPLSKRHMKSLEELLDKDVVILKPDKGDGVIILDKSDYNEKVSANLSDTSRFAIDPSQSDQTLNFQNKVVDEIKKLHKRNLIDDNLKNSLIPKGSQIPRLYGLPKIHKPQCPTRPILSMTNSPCHKLAKWLTEILKPVEKYYSKFCTKDSFEFASLIQQQRACNGGFMSSFDVVSLFPHVPLKETVDIIGNTIRFKRVSVGIPSQTVKNLLLLCTENIQFLFNGIYYRQIDGCAMGSPLGPLLANIFVGSLEYKMSSALKRHCHLYVRYVDDTFILAKSQEDARTLFKKFNEVHTNLKFTMEMESNGKLPFLDVLVHRFSEGFHTSIFRKPTSCGLLLNFHSFCPFHYKTGLIHSFFDRARKLCSPDFLDDELKFLTSIFMKNDYPPQVIQQYSTVSEPSPTVIGPKKKQVNICLPFLGDRLSRQVSRQLKSAVHPVFPAAQVSVRFRTRSLPIPSPKDGVPTLSRAGLVYAFTCACSSTYIGRTERRLEERLKEHIPKWLREGKQGPPRSKKEPDSSITRHILECAAATRNSLEQRFRIVGTARASFPLSVMEALEIAQRRPALCQQKEHVFALRLPWT